MCFKITFCLTNTSLNGFQIDICTYVHTNIYIHMHKHIHTHIYIHICIHTLCKYTYTCIH